MPMILIGPCMFVAPLLVVLLPIALVLWPPALILIGLAWLLTWPLARGDKSSGGARAHHKIGRWFWTVLRPWDYFDIPKPAAKKASAPSGAAGGTAGSTPSRASGAQASTATAAPTVDPMANTASHPTPP